MTLPVFRQGCRRRLVPSKTATPPTSTIPVRPERSQAVCKLRSSSSSNLIFIYELIKHHYYYCSAYQAWKRLLMTVGAQLAFHAEPPLVWERPHAAPAEGGLDVRCV